MLRYLAFGPLFHCSLHPLPPQSIPNSCSGYPTQVQLKHEDTGSWLSSNTRTYGRPISGQQEVCTRPKAGKHSLWRTTEGVYFPPVSPA